MYRPRSRCWPAAASSASAPARADRWIVAGRPGPGPTAGGGWWWWARPLPPRNVVFVSPRMGLSWDESVYVSQVSGHVPAAWFDPARARGVPVLVMPVAALTSSVVALRVYLSLASGLGLTVALWTWRRLRPAGVLGLAGVLFGGLWVAQYYGPQAMPDMWSALGGLAAVGCFLRGGSKALAGLAASVAFVTLVRPGDAVYPGRAAAGRGGDPAALAAGRGGGRRPAGGRRRMGHRGVHAVRRVAGRLRAAGAEQGGFGLHFALPAELRALNGPTLCRPCAIGLGTPNSTCGGSCCPSWSQSASWPHGGSLRPSRSLRGTRSRGAGYGPAGQRAAARGVRALRGRAVSVHDQLCGAAVPAARLRAARHPGRRRTGLPHHQDGRRGPGGRR